MEMQKYSTGVGPGEEDEGDLALDIIPDSSSAGVREWLKRIPQLFMARQILLTLGVVGRYQYIATNASAKEANVLVKTQDGLFSVLKSIDATSLMLQSFQSGANNILEKLKVAYLYLLDGFPDFAKTDIDAIAKDIKTMKESTEKALGVIRKTTTSIEEAHMLSVKMKNGREEQLVAIQQSIDELNAKCRRIGEAQISGSDRQTTMPNFVVFLKINTIAFLKDPASLLITVAVFVSFYLCDCHFYNYTCGWVTMILGLILFLLRFGLMKLVYPKHLNYKPVIPIILVGTILFLFPCQLLQPCESMCFVVFILAPPSTIFILFLWYHFVPEHGTNQSQTFLVFLRINTIAFLKDPVSLLITVAVLVSFYLCDCHFYNSICGWVTMILGMTLFLLRFALWKLVYRIHLDYKPVIPIILVGTILFLFPCQLFLPCESMCFVVLIPAPPSIVSVFFVWFHCAPEHWFFKVELSDSQSTVAYNSVETKDSNESLQEQQLIKDELSETFAAKQRIEASISDADLTKCFLGKALSDVKSVTGIIQQSTGVIEKWYKECKDIIEPSMDRTIQRSQSVPEENLAKYWNSMAFKKEVVGYYCRWRALQVYCETLRSECREKRATLESHYVENLYPKDAVKKAWELADEEVADPEVAQVVRENQERMNGHEISELVNNRSKDVKVDMPE